MSDIFARTELLIGRAGLARLAAARVAVIGVGGVGSFAAEALARAGIGSLLLVDHDTVSLSNINRQLHALTYTVGQPKTSVLAERLSGINPTLRLETSRQRFTPATAAELMGEGRWDFVVDAIDEIDNKTALLVYCVNRQLPVISAMGAGNKLDPTAFKIDSIWNTSVCPLARVMRKKLRDAGVSAHIPVVYSTAKPAAINNLQPGDHPLPGSISFVPPVAGFYLAAYVVDRILHLNVFS
ncbi:MAG: tRNA threonylcarbamoyladenosine dehydratase [Firmicutes bacterium]|nr:tRNA threonylcarbamoyladenosine dehydratase [Bacillota bacterium]